MPNYQKKGFLTEDYRLFHLRSDGGLQPEFHYHEFYKILLLVSGSGGYTVDGQRYALQSGDIVLIASHSVHRPEFEPGAVYERIILYISPDFLRRSSQPDAGMGLRKSHRVGATLDSKPSPLGKVPQRAKRGRGG